LRLNIKIDFYDLKKKRLTGFGEAFFVLNELNLFIRRSFSVGGNFSTHQLFNSSTL